MQPTGRCNGSSCIRQRQPGTQCLTPSACGRSSVLVMDPSMVVGLSLQLAVDPQVCSLDTLVWIAGVNFWIMSDVLLRNDVALVVVFGYLTMFVEKCLGKNVVLIFYFVLFAIIYWFCREISEILWFIFHFFYGFPFGDLFHILQKRKHHTLGL